MKRPRQLQEGKGPIELIEETFHLLRLAPAATLACYYVGSLPFVLGLLYFWSDMSRSAFAAPRLPAATLGLAVLFVWMKCWQTIFARRLLAQLTGEPVPRRTPAAVLRLVLVQTSLQPSGLFLIPVALLIMLPFAWVYAFYQNVTVLGGGEDPAAGAVFKKAWRQASLWPLQNHYALLLLKLFGVFVFLNLAVAIVMIPYLLQTLFGIETRFTQVLHDPETLLTVMLNTTFFTALFGLTYLCVDPLLKTAYVLRCFYGESLQTGQDLKTELCNALPAAKLAALFLLGFLWVGVGIANCQLPIANCFKPSVLAPLPARDEREEVPGESLLSSPLNPNPNLNLTLQSPAGPLTQPPPAALPNSTPPPATSNLQPETSSLPPQALDRSINEVIREREYAWRLPREKAAADAKEKGILAAFLDSIQEWTRDTMKTAGRWLKKFLDWLARYRRPDSGPGGGGANWIAVLQVLLLILLAALVSLLAVLLLRAWQRRTRAEEPLAAQAVLPIPDLADEHTSADQLPEDRWVELARELIERGEFRLALRAYYLASLASLAERNLISLAKFKSNRDYERELGRRSHAMPELFEAFRETVSVFDRVWYGLHEVNADLLSHFAGNVERIKTCG